MVNCPSCGSLNPPNAKYCGDCGVEISPQPSTCPKCGSDVDPQKNFCVFCGASLKAEMYPSGQRIDEESLADRIVRKIEERDETEPVERYYYTPAPVYQPPKVEVKTKGSAGWIVAIIVIIILAAVAFLLLSSGISGGAVICGSSQGFILIAIVGAVLVARRKWRKDRGGFSRR